MSGRGAEAHQMALSAVGKRAAVVFEDGTLTVFDTVTCKAVTTFENVDQTLYRVCFSIDGSKLYGACDGQVRELDASNGKELRTFAHADQV